MKTSVLLWVLAGIAVLLGVYAYVVTDGFGTRTSAPRLAKVEDQSPPAKKEKTADKPTSDKAPEKADQLAKAPGKAGQPAEIEKPSASAAAQKKPAFDIVRVEPTGDAVIAGQSEPEALIALLSNGKVVGKTTANRDGDWVITLDKPLEPGAHDLAIKSTTKDGDRQSEQRVTVAIPDDRTSEPLIVLNRPGEASKILQKPQPKDVAVAKTTDNEVIVAAAPPASGGGNTASPPSGGGGGGATLPSSGGGGVAKPPSGGGGEKVAAADPVGQNPIGLTKPEDDGQPASAGSPAVAAGPKGAVIQPGQNEPMAVAKSSGQPGQERIPAGEATQAGQSEKTAVAGAAGKSAPAASSAGGSTVAQGQPKEAAKVTPEVAADTDALQPKDPARVATAIPEKPKAASQIAAAAERMKPGGVVKDPGNLQKPEPARPSKPDGTDLKSPVAPAKAPTLADRQGVEKPTDVVTAPAPKTAPSPTGKSPTRSAGTIVAKSAPISPAPERPTPAADPNSLPRQEKKQSTAPDTATKEAPPPASSPTANPPMPKAATTPPEPSKPAAQAPAGKLVKRQEQTQIAALPKPKDPPQPTTALAAKKPTRSTSPTAKKVDTKTKAARQGKAQPAAESKPQATTRQAAKTPVVVDPTAILEMGPLSGGRGKLTARGTATPGSIVRLSLNNRDFAEVLADKNGDWSYQGLITVKPGDHKVSVELLGKDGRQTTRLAATTFTRSHDPVVSVDAVETEGGKLFIAGTTVPHGRVRLYVNDVLVGQVVANSSGAWLLEADRPLEPGRYRIRADQVGDAAGSVIARAEVPFQRDPDEVILKPVKVTGRAGGVVSPSDIASGTVGEPKAVIIRRGDNLWTISRRNYGRGIRYTTIYMANQGQIKDPHWIYPGQVFTMPERDRAWEAETN